MERARRRFLLQSATMLAGASPDPPMAHVVLPGDSIFDNARYTGGKPDVIAQLRRQQHLLDTAVRSSADAFTLLARAVRQFETPYCNAVAACLAHRLPLVICTIYNGNFPDPGYRQRVAVALAAFNDVILRTGVERRLRVIELRQICTVPEDYANAIEPSSEGARKIAQAILRATADAAAPGARVIGA